jgi:hypothetical protein
LYLGFVIRVTRDSVLYGQRRVRRGWDHNFQLRLKIIGVRQIRDRDREPCQVI